MSDVPMKCYWMGEDVETLSREQLLQAVKLLGRELESLRIASTRSRLAFPRNGVEPRTCS